MRRAGYTFNDCRSKDNGPVLTLALGHAGRPEGDQPGQDQKDIFMYEIIMYENNNEGIILKGKTRSK